MFFSRVPAEAETDIIFVKTYLSGCNVCDVCSFYAEQKAHTIQKQAAWKNCRQPLQTSGGRIVRVSERIVPGDGKPVVGFSFPTDVLPRLDGDALHIDGLRQAVQQFFRLSGA